MKKVKSLYKAAFITFFLLCFSNAQNDDYKEWLQQERLQKKRFEEKGALESDKTSRQNLPKQEIKREETISRSTSPKKVEETPVTDKISDKNTEKQDEANNKVEEKVTRQNQRKTSPYTEISPLYVFVKKTVLNLYEGMDASESNYINILNDGYDALILRIHLIRNAKKSINIQTYILADDETGRFIISELLAAARRGVQVKVLADHFSSFRNTDLIAFLATAHPNFEIKYYRPSAKMADPSDLQEVLDYVVPNKTNQRMHNKLFLVDDFIGITGGRNIQNCYYNFGVGINFRDRDVILIGPLAQEMRDAFDKYWTYKRSINAANLKDVKSRIGKIDMEKCESHFAADEMFSDIIRKATDSNYIIQHFADKMLSPKHVSLVVDKPGKNRKFFFFYGQGEITKAISKVVKNAKNSLIMQSPYLVLDKAAIKMFEKMKKKNPKLRLAVSSNSFGSTDNLIAYSANYKMRFAYIDRAGLEIYEYKPHPDDMLKILPQYPVLERKASEQKKKKPFLCIHAKSFVMDSTIAFVGSYNLAPRSANLNTEIGLLIDDPLVARLLEDDILNDMSPANSWVVAKREVPYTTEKINELFETISMFSPISLWPFSNTSSFELIPGKTPCRPGSPEFYQNYHDIGAFPGAGDEYDEKEIATMILKTINGLASRLL